MTTTRAPFHAKATRSINRVTTRRGVQNHRGWTGWVYLHGYRKPFPTYTWHQKEKAAKREAEKFGRWLLKDPANIEWALARKGYG